MPRNDIIRMALEADAGVSEQHLDWEFTDDSFNGAVWVVS
jgi:hypothetical protein